MSSTRAVFGQLRTFTESPTITVQAAEAKLLHEKQCMPGSTWTEPAPQAHMHLLHGSMKFAWRGVQIKQGKLVLPDQSSCHIAPVC